MSRYLHPAALALGLMLAACNGGGGGAGSSGGDSAPVTANPNYYPMLFGYRWTYANSGSGTGLALNGPSMVRIEPSTLAGAVFALQGALLNSETFFVSHFVKTPTAVVQVFPADFTTFPGTLGSLPVLRLPIASGDHYFAYNFVNHDYGADLDSDSVNERIDLSEEITVGGVETVTVPAGTFTDAIKVHSVHTHRLTYSQDGHQSLIVTSTDNWYVPDVGRIKSVSSTSGTLGTGSSTSLLTGYRGLTYTDTTQPTVTQTFPAEGGTISSLTGGQPTELTVDYSEDMDPYWQSSVAPENSARPVLIFDAGHNMISANFEYRYQNRRLVIRPDTALAPGNYTALIVGFMDALGNGMLSTPELHFTVN